MTDNCSSECCLGLRAGLLYTVLLVVIGAAGDAPRTRAEPTLVATVNVSSEEADVDGSFAACATEVRLSGTLCDVAHPERSFAMLHLGAKLRGEVHREGESVRGLEIESIEPDGVVMRDEHGSCWLNITRMPSKKPTRAVAGHSPSLRFTLAPPAFSTAELERAIRASGEHAYEVKRSLLQRAIGLTAQLARTIRLGQVRHDGAVTAIELRGLTRNGLLAHLGLLRGDTLKSLNGVSLAGIEDRSTAQKLIESAPRLRLLLMRDGRILSLEYHVVD